MAQPSYVRSRLPLHNQYSIAQSLSPSLASANPEDNLTAHPTSEAATTPPQQSADAASSVIHNECVCRLPADYWRDTVWCLRDTGQKDGSVSVEIGPHAKDEPIKASMVLTKNADQPPSFCPTFFRPSTGGGDYEHPFHYRKGTRPVTCCYPTMAGDEENEVMIAYEEDEDTPVGMAPTQGEGQFFLSRPLPRGTVKSIMNEYAAAGVLMDMASRDSPT